MSNRNTMTIQLTHSQMRDAAMRQAGLDPRLVAIKPGVRHHRNRKALTTRVKHKGQPFQ